MGDYGGNHGDLSPGSVGESSDFYFGGNGTGVIISSRPICEQGKPVGWTDRVRSSKVKDGLSNTFLVGEMHISRKQMGLLPNDGPIYCGSKVHYATRVAGPGARLAVGPMDETASQYSFGSWHRGICHFSMADGSVRAMSIGTGTNVLSKLANRNNGKQIDVN